MTHDLTDTNVLVTGGSRGIGRAIVESFSEAGCRVAFTYRSSEEEAQALADQLEANGSEVQAYQGDVRDIDSASEIVGDVLERWETLDVLVNNAGITRDGLMIRMGEEDWDDVIETNLKSVFNFAKAAYRPMMKQRSGRIVNVSSVVGISGNPGQANYAASKAGIIGFSKSLAKELAGRSITVNVVAPGYVETDMTAALGEKALQAMLDAIPLGRPAHPSEVADAVLFLASPASKYITGHVLSVDGGMAM